MKFKNGSWETDLALYAAWGETHSVENRENAARAAFCLLWGGDWESTPQPSTVVRAVDRLLAFAGDIDAERIALQWKLIYWRDIDGGSRELVNAAQKWIRASFKAARSPSGGRFWSNLFTFARAAFNHTLDCRAVEIVSSIAHEEIVRILGGTMITYAELAHNPALTVRVATGHSRFADFLAAFPIEQAGVATLDILHAGEDHPQYDEALSDLLAFGRVRDEAGDLWGIIDLWEIAGSGAWIILERF